MDRRPPPHYPPYLTPPLNRSTPPHRYDNPPRNNAPSSTGDSRIHRRSVLDSEQLRTPFSPSPSTDERLTEFQSEFQRSQAAMVNLMQSMQALQASMQMMLEKLDRRNEESRSPDSHHRGEHVLPHQIIPEASTLFKQLKTESIESTTPAATFQDSVHRLVSPSHIKQVITEMVPLQEQEQKPAHLHLLAKSSSMQQPGNSNLSGFAANMMSNGIFQEFCSKFGVNPLILSNSKQLEPVAAQVFEETPQPSVKAAGDENEGRKSKKPEAPQANNPSKVLEFHHVQEVQGLDVKFLVDDGELEASFGVKKVQNQTLDFPELSFEVMTDNCKLETNFLLAAHLVLPFSQVIRMKGEEKERIGVG